MTEYRAKLDVEAHGRHRNEARIRMYSEVSIRMTMGDAPALCFIKDHMGSEGVQNASRFVAGEDSIIDRLLSTS